MYRWAITVGVVNASSLKAFDDDELVPKEVKMLRNIYGSDKIRSWALCGHNNSFCPLLYVRCGDGIWVEFPTVDTLLKHKSSANKVCVVRAVPLVGVSVHVVTVDRFARDCLSPRQASSPTFDMTVATRSPVQFVTNYPSTEDRSRRLFQVDSRRLRKMYSYVQSPHGLITPEHHNNAAHVRCAFVVLEDISEETVPLNAVSSARARTWKNWDAALVQYATLGRDRRVLGVEKHVEFVRALLGVDVDDDFFVLKRGSVWMQVNRPYRRRQVGSTPNVNGVIVSHRDGNVVSVDTNTLAVSRLPNNTNTVVCTHNTGCDVFSSNADTSLVDSAIAALYKITHERTNTQAVENAHLINSLFQSDASDFLQICSQMKNQDPHILMKKMGSHCCLRSLEIVDVAAWMWWPDVRLAIFTQDIGRSQCADINESVGYELLQFDDMLMCALVRVNVTQHPHAQFVLVDDLVQLWCVTTGDLIQLGVMRNEDYDMMETEIKPMSRKHVRFVPGGVLRRTIMLRPLVTRAIPFTACVVDTEGTVHWLLHHKKGIFSNALHKAPEYGGNFGLSALERVPPSLLTDEYKVPKAKVMQLLNNPIFSTAVSMLTLTDTRTLLYALHSNATYLNELAFANPMNMQIEDQSKYWMWSNNSIRSPNKRLCVVCAHTLGVADHNTDPIRKHIIDAILTKKTTFVYRTQTHTITTCAGCVCVTTTQNGQTVEVWRDQVPQNTRCQFCALKRESGRVFLSPKYFEHTVPQGSIAETIQSTILALCLNSKQVQVSRTCMLASTVLLQVLLTFLTSDAPWITDDFLEHLVKNVLFPHDVMRAVYTARVGNVRKHDVGSGFHLEQTQIMRLPSMLLLTQACVAATLHMYVGANAHKSMDSNFCVSHNMARGTMQHMFSKVVVGSNLLVALYKTSDFLARYAVDMTPTHSLLFVAEKTQRVLVEMLRCVDGDILRTHITHHMLYLNFMSACVVFNALSPMITFCDNKLRVCGMTYTEMHNNIIAPLVTHIVSKHPDQDVASHDVHGDTNTTTLSTIPCRLLANDTPGELYYCQTHNSHAVCNGWVDCDASIDTDALLGNKWCSVCNKPLSTCPHHCVSLDTVGCLKCGQYACEIGSLLNGYTREERLLYSECAVSSQHANIHASLERMSRHIAERASARLYVTNKQVGLPGSLTTKATSVASAPLELVSLDSMEAVHHVCSDMTYVRKNHTKMQFYREMSTAVCLDNTVFSLLCWARWCAAFASGGCVPHDCVQSVVASLCGDKDQRAPVTHMLKIVLDNPDSGWVDLFLYAFGDEEKILLATNIMLTTQRVCVLNATSSKQHAAMLYGNVMQVSYWAMGVAEECAFKQLVAGNQLGKSTKRNACAIYTTHHLRILVELSDFATHVLDTTGVVGTIDMEFTRFATWMICIMLRKRYHLDGHSQEDLLSQAFKHFQFDHTPCVRCAAGRVCLKTGICSTCSCVANEFDVPFGSVQKSVQLGQDHNQTCEMIANVDTLPGRVICGDHREFVDIVLQTLLERRWKNDERLLRDVLTCHTATVCDTKRVQIDKCAVIQHACVFWNTNCDKELRQQLRTNELSLWHVARGCERFLMPQHQPPVSMIQLHATPSMQYNENICSLPALREMVSILLFYNNEVAFRLDGVPESVLASFVKDAELHTRLLAAANRVSVGMHNIIHARLRQSATVVDTSVLHLIESCARMYASAETRRMYATYVEFVNGVVLTYQQNLARHGDTLYVFFECDALQVTTGTIFEFLINVVRLGHVLIRAHNTISIRTTWLQRLRQASTASLRGERDDASAHYTQEDEFFIRVALKDAYLMPQIEARVRAGKFLFTGIPDYLLKCAFDKLNMKVTVAVSRLHQAKKLKTHH